MDSGDRRGAKKNRARDRDFVETELREYVFGPPKQNNGMITDEDLERAGSEHIHNRAHLQVFLYWQALGGMARGLSLLEAATLPSTLLRDMVYLMTKTEELRDSKRAMEKAKDEAKRKADSLKKKGSG